MLKPPICSTSGAVSNRHPRRRAGDSHSNPDAQGDAEPVPVELEDANPSADYLTFDEMVVRYQGEIYHYVFHLTRTRAEAADLYQETVHTAFRGFDRLDGTTNHRAWLYTLATTAYLRDRRSAGRQGSSEVERTREITDAPENFDLLPEVKAFVADLPRQQRVALVQRTFHDRSYAEIAASLHCSEAAARANVYETIRALRHHLGGQV